MRADGPPAGGWPMPALDGIEPPVVVGCSGGADSVALLDLAASAGLMPVAVHVDHGLRAGSDADGRLVTRVAERLGCPSVVIPVALPPGGNLEARARQVRYKALEAARAERGATAILVAHTADDQAETVIANLLRGSGVRGAAGMPARRGVIARPLLTWRRAETRRWCTERGLPFTTDPMNEDPAFTRARIRAEVLPLLADVAGRDVVPLLARHAEVARADAELLDALGDALLSRAGDPPDARVLCAADTAIARHALRRWLGAPPVSSAELERVLAVTRGEARAAQLAGGRRVHRHGQRLSVT